MMVRSNHELGHTTCRATAHSVMKKIVKNLENLRAPSRFFKMLPQDDPQDAQRSLKFRLIKEDPEYACNYASDRL